MLSLIGELITSDGNLIIDAITSSTTAETTLSPVVRLIDFCDEDHMETFNCTKEAFVEHERGLKTQELWDAIPVTLLYTITFLAGIVGNLIICIVIIRHPSMQTATNYYLFNLAVSDMIYLLFGLPFEILLFWHQYPWLFGLPFCKFRALMAEACSYVSVLTIVAFSMERFLAICYPLHSYAMSGFKRAVRIIATIWLISLISATPFAYYREIEYIRYPPPNGTEVPESSLCRALLTPSGLYETSTIIFFAIPMLIIIVLYGQMAFEIRLRSKQSIADGLGIRSINAKQTKSRRSIIKMLAVVVLTFFISWAPFHAQRLVYEYGKQWPNFELINKFLFAISGFFYYFACTINPIIYNMMSQRYRIAFRETLCGKKQQSYTITATTTPTQLSRTTTTNNGGNKMNNLSQDQPNNSNNNNTNNNNNNNNNNNSNDSTTATTITHDAVVISSTLTDPFDADHGSFPRTRSMRRSQNRSMRRNGSINSRSTAFTDLQSESLISYQAGV